MKLFSQVIHRTVFCPYDDKLTANQRLVIFLDLDQASPNPAISLSTPSLLFFWYKSQNRTTHFTSKEDRTTKEARWAICRLKTSDTNTLLLLSSSYPQPKPTPVIASAVYAEGKSTQFFPIVEMISWSSRLNDWSTLVIHCPNRDSLRG